MNTYNPSLVPQDYDERWMRQELGRIQTALNNAQEDYKFTFRSGPPNKAVPGMVAFADGVNWSPTGHPTEHMIWRSQGNTQWRYVWHLSSAPSTTVNQWAISPTSANLGTAMTDMTGTGLLVFADAPTISNPTVSGNIFAAQGAPFSFSGSVTATLTQLRTKLLQYTGAGAANLTMPTGTDLDAVFGGALPINHGFDFTVRNKGGGTVTIVTAAGVTLDEAFTIAAAATGSFRARKTATNAFTVYRIA